MKTAILIGATGLVGSELLKLLLKSTDYSKVIIFVRKDTEIQNAKLEQHIINFDEIDLYSNYIKGDDFFNCLGTTLKKAKSKDNFIKIDFHYLLVFSEIAKKNQVKKILTITSIGADSSSNNYYLKTKGLLEEKIKKIEFISTFIFRPSILLGNRKEIRFGERIGIFFLSVISPFLLGKLKKYKPIKSEQLAKAMYQSAQTNIKGFNIYESNTIQKF